MSNARLDAADSSRRTTAIRPESEELYRRVWGNAALIVDGRDITLPPLPDHYGWLLTRQVTSGHRTYHLALHYIGDRGGDGNQFRVVRSGLIDKDLYGESGVRELAQRYVTQLVSHE